MSLVTCHRSPIACVTCHMSQAMLSASSSLHPGIIFLIILTRIVEVRRGLDFIWEVNFHAFSGSD